MLEMYSRIFLPRRSMRAEPTKTVNKFTRPTMMEHQFSSIVLPLACGRKKIFSQARTKTKLVSQMNKVITGQL